MGVSLFRSFDHGCIIRHHRHASDVFFDGAIKELNPLGQVSNMLTQDVWVILIQGGTIQPNLTACWSPYTGQSPRQCRLARPRCSDHTNRMAGLHIEADCAQRSSLFAWWHDGQLLYFDPSFRLWKRCFGLFFRNGGEKD